MIGSSISLFHLRSCIQYNWRLYSLVVVFWRWIFHSLPNDKTFRFAKVISISFILSNIYALFLLLLDYQNNFSDFAFASIPTIIFFSQREYEYFVQLSKIVFFEREKYSLYFLYFQSKHTCSEICTNLQSRRWQVLIPIVTKGGTFLSWQMSEVRYFSQYYIFIFYGYSTIWRQHLL